jgi:hypothetical protein
MCDLSSVGNDAKSDGEDYSSSSDADKDADADEVDVAALVPGLRVVLIDGAEKKFANTTILDMEPKPTKGFPGRLGDMVMVRGGHNKVGFPKKTAMQVVSGWEKTAMWAKAKAGKNTPSKWEDYPGVLAANWTFFTQDMTPGNLMKLDCFLIDRRHIYIKPKAPAKTAAAAATTKSPVKKKSASKAGKSHKK